MTTAAPIPASKPHRKYLLYFGCCFRSSANSAENFRDSSRIVAVTKLKAAENPKTNVNANCPDRSSAPDEIQGKRRKPPHNARKRAPIKRTKLLPNHNPAGTASDRTHRPTASLTFCGRRKTERPQTRQLDSATTIDK